MLRRCRTLPVARDHPKNLLFPAKSASRMILATETPSCGHRQGGGRVTWGLEVPWGAPSAAGPGPHRPLLPQPPVPGSSHPKSPGTASLAPPGPRGSRKEGAKPLVPPAGHCSPSTATTSGTILVQGAVKSWCEELRDPWVLLMKRDAGSWCEELHDPRVFLMKRDARSRFTGLHNPNTALPSPPTPSLPS